MEQIVVRQVGRPDLPLVKRDPLSTVTKATQNVKLLSEDTVTLTVESVAPIDFYIGDTILTFGTVYTLNQLPTATKIADRHYVYELTFEGPQYSLLRVLFLNEDVGGFATGPDFTLTGDLAMFAGVLLTNLQRVLGTTWTMGPIPPGTATKTLSFNGENALAVLQKLCTEFETEFEILQTGLQTGLQTILQFGKIGQLLGHAFQYGRGNGLYELSRQTITGEAFVTRLYAYGGNKNIPSTYRGYSQRLKLDNGLSFIENARSKQAFGLIEGTKVWEDIYPHRTGKISGVGPLVAGVKTFTLTDVTIDFNLTEEKGPPLTVNGKPQKDLKYLIPGVSAKVHFNTGGLAGYEFEVSGYDHATKTFTLIVIQDERGLALPSADSTAFQVKAGDEYVLLDVLMPPAYVDAAEAKLLKTAQDYLAAHSAPRVQYSLSPDELYFKRSTVDGSSLPNFFQSGDYVEIIDTDLNIEGASRVVAFTRDVLNPFSYTVEIADTYEITLVERILSEQAAVNTVIRLNNLSDPARARYGWRTTQELLNLVFDTDDYFNGENIKPESIETSMIVVGAKSQQFILNCVIEPNFEGQVNVVRVNAGSLTHYTVQETIKTWTIAAGTVTITDDAPRYIYARCSKTVLSEAGLLFSTAQIKPNDDASYYHFLVGVLHQKDAGLNVRWISLTYGATAINGRFIKTGRIQSFDGGTYFDLDAGEIGGKITFLANDGVTRPIAELVSTTINGGIITSGTIELGGVGGAIKAGITGEGTAETSVRMWAGASKANRALAPFRVLQSGELFARKRIELMNESNVGQAGISGSNATADGPVRIWAGSPYAGRNTAPFRVSSDGSMVSTSGNIGRWVITGDGILNDDGNAYIIARSSTNVHRTEARIGAQVFPSTFGGKGASYFVATEPDPLFGINYAGVFQAANGLENYALYAQTGTSLLGEALLNGRKYLGQSINNVTLLVDPGNYDVIELYPTGNCGLKFIRPAGGKAIRNGKIVYVINANDGVNVVLYETLRPDAAYTIGGGVVVTLIYSNNFWYVAGNFNNNFSSPTPPFIPEPPNPAPTVASPIPDLTLTDRTITQYTIPAAVFSDPGDPLSYEVTSFMPPGLTFQGGNRTFSFAPELANGTYPITVKATDSDNQSVSDSFVLTVNRPVLNTAPVYNGTLPDQTVQGTAAASFELPFDSFSDDTALTYVAQNAVGGGLPTGVTFNAATGPPARLTFTVSPTAPEGTYAIRVTATDGGGLSASGDFTLTISRTAGGPSNQAYTTATNEGYTAVVGDGVVTVPPPTPEPETGDFGVTRIVSGNSDVLKPVVEWNPAKTMARIRNTATPDVPAGQNPYYYLDGQPYASALATTYDFPPGTEVTIYFVISSNQQPYAAPFNIKGYAKIYIGNPPD